MEKESMAPETGAEAGYGGGSAAEGTGDLAMSGAGLKECGDGTEELRALEVVEEGEGVLGEGPSTAKAAEPGDAAAAAGEVGAVQADGEGAATAAMLGTGGPGAETGMEIEHSFEGGSRPVHTG